MKFAENKIKTWHNRVDPVVPHLVLFSANTSFLIRLNLFPDFLPPFSAFPVLSTVMQISPSPMWGIESQLQVSPGSSTLFAFIMYFMNAA